jgi:hypothetical protein
MSKVLSACNLAKLLKSLIRQLAVPDPVGHTADFVHSFELYYELSMRPGNPLFAAQAHIDLSLTDAALPWKQTEQGEDGALEDTLAR